MSETTTDTVLPFNKLKMADNRQLPDFKSLAGSTGAGSELETMIAAGEPQPEYIGGKEKLYSSDDPAYKQPRSGFTCEVHIFDLSKEDELIKYQEILDKAGTSRYSRIRYIERHWVESTSSWKVLIELQTMVLVDPDLK